jgi:hypothetical protein
MLRVARVKTNTSNLIEKEDQKMNRLIKVVVLCGSLLLATLGTTFAGDPQRGGDVVGRENKIGFLLGPLGHLGLYDANNRVIIEIGRIPNTTNTVIWNSSVSAFKTSVESAKYWGAKYIVGAGSIDLTNVVKAASDQRTKYYNVDWTPTSTAIPGQIAARYKYDIWNNRWVYWDNYKVKPKFRCDTFVNWAHLTGNYKAIVGTSQNGKTDYQDSNTKKITYDQFIYQSSFLYPKDVFASYTLRSR